MMQDPAGHSAETSGPVSSSPYGALLVDSAHADNAALPSLHTTHADHEPLLKEPETPLWFTLLGIALFVVAGIGFLMWQTAPSPPGSLP